MISQDQSDQPNIELFVGGQVYKWWVGAVIRLDLEALVRTADLECAYTIKEGIEIKAGEKVEIKIDGELVLTGYIDRVEHNVKGDDFSLHVNIRSKTADLVDCSAGVKQIKNRDAKSVAESICEPFGISVVWDSERDPKKITWKIEPMDSCFEVLGMIARECNLILTDNAKGEVVFTEAGTEDLGELSLGVDILELNVSDDWSNRFSDYIAMGDNPSYKDATPSTSGDTKLKKGNAKTTVKDEAINRYRPFIIMTDDVATGESTKERAEFERDRNIAFSKLTIATVRGWKHAGKVWDINKQLSVKAAPICDDSKNLIVVVELVIREDEGYISDLWLAPPEGYGSKMYNEPPKAEGSGKGKGRPDWIDGSTTPSNTPLVNPYS